MDSFKAASDISAVIIFMFAIWNVSECFSRFQQHIPNGDRVRHPCMPEQFWPALGHLDPSASPSDRNPFGLDFKYFNLTYTEALHYKDSDGDGVPNGDELNVILINDSYYMMGDPISHPGICEPPDHPRCASQAFSCSQNGVPQGGLNMHMPGTDMNIGHNNGLNIPQNNNPFG